MCSPAELEAARRPPQAAPRAAPPPGPGAAAAAAVREAQAANGTQERPLLLRRRCRQPDPDRPHPLRRGPPEVSDFYSVSLPCPVLWGFLSPPPVPHSLPPPPHVGSTTKLPSGGSCTPGSFPPFSSQAWGTSQLFGFLFCLAPPSVPGIPPSYPCCLSRIMLSLKP